MIWFFLKKEPTRQEIQIMQFTRETFSINSKLSNRDKNITLLKFCHYCWSLLWWNFSRCLMPWNSTCWSRLTVQIQLAFHPCDSFLINDCKITRNSAEKHCFLALNVKLQVKLGLKTFLLTLNPVIYYFCLEQHYQHGLFCSNYLYTPPTSV